MNADTTAMPQHDTTDLFALDQAHVWHPFTPMKQWRETEPLIIERAHDAFLIDTAGRRYIDGTSSLWCNVHGHHVQQMDKAIRNQLHKVAHTTLLGLASPTSIELAERLCAIAPGRLNKVFYSDSGATAVEVALKMAVGYFYHRGQPQRRRFIRFTGAYHGDTTGCMSIGYSELFHLPFGAMCFPSLEAPAPDPCRVPANLVMAPRSPGQYWPSADVPFNASLRDACLKQLRDLLEQHVHEVAAIVIEPLVQGAAGIVCHPTGFLRGVAELARQHGVLLIADEVATGFGRTGEMFACDHEDVCPDLLCLGKGISGGYLPLAATLATDDIEQAFCGALADRRTLFHGHTYTGNALACAAALASLDLFEQRDLLNHIQRSARIIRHKLETLQESPHVRDVRQRGIMTGIELCADRATGLSPEPLHQTAHRLCMAMREDGVILRPLGDVIVLMPIPAMGHDTLHQMLDVVVQTILRWDLK